MIPAELHGFDITKIRAVPELNGTMVEMVHARSGAKLAWLDNKQDNKLFCVTFKTIPENSTGVFHILEHAVLCGSEKYPVREPFVELMKSSMNTFLNAITFPDKTMYPVSSRNRQDYLNLVSVYLDAVFAPRLLEDPNIFYQEGWHASLSEDPCYKGVVYNEMKGAMSGVDECIEQGMLQLLFPDTCYRHNSGGDPKEITDLTYEQFTDAYRRFYRPGNALFYLDGDVPLEETLALIDNYLCRASGEEQIPDIAMQQPTTRENTLFYEVTEGENGENKAILVLGKLLCTWQDRVKIMATQVLCDVLAGSNESPLKRAVLSTGLAEDLRCHVADGIAQPYFTLQIRNMAQTAQDKIRAVIRSAAEDLMEQGISKRALRSGINAFAYGLSQKPEPQGLYRAMDVMTSWLYGGDVLQNLQREQMIAALHEMASADGFERLLRELLLSDDGLCVLHMLPSATLGGELLESEQTKLTCILQTVDADVLRSQNEALSCWQQTDDTPEQLSTIPMLSLDQIGEMPAQPQTQELELYGTKVLYHPVLTVGNEYLSIYFSLEDYTMEHLGNLAIGTSLLGKLPTKVFDALQLLEEIKLWVGSLDFSVDVYAKGGDLSACFPCLHVRAGYLKENREKVIELILEILRSTNFRNKEAIREIVMQQAENAKYAAIMSGHALAASVVQAHYTAQGAVQEAISGFTGLQRLQGLANQFDKGIDELIEQMESLRDRVFCRTRMVVSLTATDYPDLSPMLLQFPEGEVIGDSVKYKTQLPKRIGIQIPAQISYAVKGYHLSQCKKSYDATISVLDNVLSLSLLWNQIRVQGGAYGTGMQTDRRGSLLFYSYRDPTPARSLNVYDYASTYVEKIDEALNGYIISCVAAMEPLRSAAAQGRLADQRWFAGLDEETLREHRQQILATTTQMLHSWKDSLAQMAWDGAVCVVGHKDALETCEDLAIYTL